MADLRRALGIGEEREWISRAIVVKRQGSDERYEREGDDVLVECDLVPGGQPVTARLGGIAWRIPPEGAEVAVFLPEGKFDAAPVIVCEVGGVPEVVANGDTVLAAPDGKLVLSSAADDVEIDSGDGKKVLLQGGGKGAARKDDPTDDGTIAITYVGAGTLNIIYTPGDGSAPQSLSNAGTLVLKGKIASASTKVECG